MRIIETVLVYSDQDSPLTEHLAIIEHEGELLEYQAFDFLAKAFRGNFLGCSLEGPRGPNQTYVGYGLY